MRKSLRSLLHKIFVSLFLTLYTFIPSVGAVDTILEDFNDEVVPTLEEGDILDEGVSDPEWIAKPESTYEDGVYTINMVEEKEYVYPDNDSVRVEFTSVTEEGNLVIRRVLLTEEEKLELNTTDDYGWDITSSMGNGSFRYNLTLPNTQDGDVKVVYTEDGDVYEDVDSIVNENLIHIYGLDHFTMFVVTADATPLTGATTPTCVEAGASSNSSCYISIQDAVTAATDGDTILVKAGTHTLSSQLIIDKDLTIIGEDETTTIIVPGFNTSSSGDGRGLILINNNVVVNIYNITIDGAGFNVYQAIRVNNANIFNLSNSTFQNINFSKYIGFGIALMDTDGTIENVSMNNIERVGTIVLGNSNYTFDNYMYTGKGNGDWIDYGIELGGGGNAYIKSSYISDCRGVASLDGSKSGAIIATTYDGPGTGGDIEYSDFENNSTAILVGYNNSSDTSIVKTQYNDFANNDLGVSTTAPQVDARNNKWGTIKESEIQNLIEGDVLYDPWYGKNVTEELVVNEFEKDGVYYVKLNDILDFSLNGNPVYKQKYIAGLWGYESTTGSRNATRYIGWESLYPDSTDSVSVDKSWDMVTTGWIGSDGPGTTIPEGDYLLWVERYYEEGGYVQGSTKTKRITVDNTRPVLSVVKPIAGQVTKGAVDISITAEDSQTDISSVSMHIYRINDSSKTLVTGCTSIPTLFDGITWNTTINNGGRCNLTEGRYEIAAWAYDGVQNPGWAKRIQFVIDNTNPTGSIDGIKYPNGTVQDKFITNLNTPVLIGSADDNNGVKSVEVKIGTYTSSSVSLDTGIWEAEFSNPIPDGTHTVELTITDLADNVTVVTENITIDTVAPTAQHKYFKSGEEIKGSLAYVRGVNELTFEGKYYDEDPSSGLYWDSFVIFEAQDDGSFRFSANGKRSFCGWRTSPNLIDLSTYDGETRNFTDCIDTLPDGNYYMAHHIYDNATRKDIPSINQFRDVLGLNFIVDTIPPVTNMTDISGSYHNSSIPLEGTTTDDNNIDYVEIRISPAGENNWELLETLYQNEGNVSTFNWSYDWTPEEEGVYDISAHGFDFAGNEERTAVVYSVTYDTTAPEIRSLNIMVDYLSRYVNGTTGFMMSTRVSDFLSGIDTDSCIYTLDGSMWKTGFYSGGRCYFTVSSSQLLDNQSLQIQTGVSDLAGNPTVSGVVNRTVDAQRPSSETHIDEIYYGPNSMPVIRGIADDTVSDVSNVMITIKRASDNRYWMRGNIWLRIPTMHNVSGTNSWTYNGSLPRMQNGEAYTITPYAWDQVHMMPGVGSSDLFIWDNELPVDPDTIGSAHHTVGVPVSNNVIHIRFEGAYDNISGVKGYYYSFSNNPETPAIDPTYWLESGEDNVTSPVLEDGEWYFNIRTLDNAGNITSTAHYGPLVVDTTAAIITWDLPVDGDILQTPTLLSASTNETMNNVRFKWKYEDGEWNTGVNNNTKDTEYEYEFNPAVDGKYTIRVQGRDLALNWSRANPDIVITVDNTAPVLSQIEDFTLLEGDTLNPVVIDVTEVNGIQEVCLNLPDHSYEMCETRIDPDATQLDLMDFILNNFGVTTVDTTVLPVGTHSLEYYVYDLARNKSDVMSFEVEILKNIPSVAILGATTGPLGTSFTLSADITDGNAPFAYNWSGACTGNTQTISFTPAASGTYECAVTVTDVDGDTDTQTHTIIIPAVLGATDDNSTTNGDTNTTTYAYTYEPLGIGGPNDLQNTEEQVTEEEEMEEEEKDKESDEEEVKGTQDTEEEEKGSSKWLLYALLSLPLLILIFLILKRRNEEDENVR